MVRGVFLAVAAALGTLWGWAAGPPFPWGTVTALGVALGGLAVEALLRRVPARAVLCAACGGLAGFAGAEGLFRVFWPGGAAPLGRPLAALAGMYLGAAVAVTKLPELNLAAAIRILKEPPRAESVKILDTSVIIDGRVADVLEAGFLEGTLVVPAFVLRELQHIADSSDPLKRNRGRRGLDILQKMQRKAGAGVEISEQEFPEIREVDAKLVALAKRLGAAVVTNDFNLNKVCELHGVRVLNVNELTNALRPVVLPGEDMRVYVLKEGKEANQGVAYLDDGTMVVIDNGRRHIGQTIDVCVTSVLQTTAGRMIFSRLKEEAEAA
ncbi:MAG TPA: PIN domain-containing protein [Candidatus Sulfotelmatobacter sp.]|nr:PIN domain-containing protein [Candidatus Sulfotelmatobacter sp.]